MNKTSILVDRITESATLAMARRSRELIAQGVDVISLSLGEPDFPTPDYINLAAKEAIEKNFTKYTPVNGYDDLRQVISNKFKRDNNLNYTPAQIVVSAGAKQSIANVVLSLVNEGDEVIIPAPYWVSYYEIIKMINAIPIVVSADVERNYKVSANDIERAITPKTKMIIFSSPCNPSGSVFSYEELEGFAKVLKKNPNIFAISDEIYEQINFVGKHTSLASFNEIYDQVITVNGVSKAYSMTGWRIGYLGAPEWIARACTKLQGQFTSGACSIAQKAAKAAIAENPAKVAYMRDAFMKRRNLVVDMMRKIPGVKLNVPDGAFYVLPDISSFFGKSTGKFTINTASDLCDYLLDEVFVALVSGEPFGAEKCIRFSYAASEENLKRAIERISIGLSKLQ
jgi:aspartate aminotransferase